MVSQLGMNESSIQASYEVFIHCSPKWNLLTESTLMTCVM